MRISTEATPRHDFYTHHTIIFSPSFFFLFSIFCTVCGTTTFPISFILGKNKRLYLFPFYTGIIVMKNRSALANRNFFFARVKVEFEKGAERRNAAKKPEFSREKEKNEARIGKAKQIDENFFFLKVSLHDFPFGCLRVTRLGFFKYFSRKRRKDLKSQ